ncbi:MAG: hypothetical protein ABJ360_22325 [Roseobacter sp.]
MLAWIWAGVSVSAVSLVAVAAMFDPVVATFIKMGVQLCMFIGCFCLGLAKTKHYKSLEIRSYEVVGLIYFLLAILTAISLAPELKKFGPKPIHIEMEVWASVEDWDNAKIDI